MQLQGRVGGSQLATGRGGMGVRNAEQETGIE